MQDEAFGYYVEEIRRNPQSANAWRRRAGCWRDKGEYDGAIKGYDEPLRLVPNRTRPFRAQTPRPVGEPIREASSA